MKRKEIYLGDRPREPLECSDCPASVTTQGNLSAAIHVTQSVIY